MSLFLKYKKSISKIKIIISNFNLKLEIKNKMSDKKPEEIIIENEKKPPKSTKSQNTFKDFHKICRAYYDELMHLSKNKSPSLSKKDIIILADVIDEIVIYSKELLDSNFIIEAKKILDIGLVISDFLLKIFEKMVEAYNNKIKKEEKLNGNQKENIENKDDNIISNDINDYITSVPIGSFLKKIKPLKRRSVYQSCKDLTSKSYRDNKEKNFQLHKDEKIPFHESSEKVMINEDSKMYADLLEIIYELYQNGKITYEQKVKLKKLIIKKCPKILSIYKNFQSDDNEKLAEQLKELV
jgi:hypothetical protein